MFTILLLTTLLALLIANQLRKRAKLPPGPFPFPLIGNLPQIAWMTMRYDGIVGAMREWNKIYGPIFTFWLGPIPTVHICTMELAQETMLKRGGEFVDRWMPPIAEVSRKGKGVVGSNGDAWVEQRRFALHTLRNFGMSRSLMEDRIMEEFNMRTDALDQKIGKNLIEIDPQPVIDILVGSIINRMLFNESLDEKNGFEFYKCKKNLDMLFEEVSVMDMFLHYKSLWKFPIIRDRVKRLTQPELDVQAFLKKQLDQRRREISSGEHVLLDAPDDYVDAFLMKMEEEKGDLETTYEEEGLIVNLMDLWTAGQETTATTLLAGIGYLLNNTEVISKVREELLTVTRGQRPLSLKDKSQTLYFNATITEIQRHASILNINVFRQTADDIIVRGHPVEKGTPIVAEISVLMSDETRFKNSKKFDPSRFMNGDKLEQFVTPFGMGKRSCLGESLARAELFLILGNLLLKYHIEPSDVLPVTEQVNNVGILKRPSKYTLRIKKLE